MKSDLVISKPGVLLAEGGANSATCTAVEDDHQPTQEPSETCGLLRMEDKFWVLASESDFDSKEEGVELCRLIGANLPDLGEGFGSISFSRFVQHQSIQSLHFQSQSNHIYRCFTWICWNQYS